MASACPTCGGVTSSKGACARCKKREGLRSEVNLDDEGAGETIPELDMPAPPPLVAVSAPASAATKEAPRDLATGAREGAPRSTPDLAVDAGRLLAAYGAPPRNPFDAVPYALRVHLRLAELRKEREDARAQKPHEVPLYDAALTAYDETGYTTGLAVLGSTIVATLLLVVTPLLLALLRSASAPD